MAPRENFLRSVANMENALASALNAASGNSTPTELERLLKLIIKKEIVLEFLLEDVFPPNGNGECPCKFRLGIAGNAANAMVTVINPDGTTGTTFTGTINFSAVQCFTGGPNCNPAVDNFRIAFEDNGNTINFTQGRRGTIACVDNIVATLQGGTAQASGNVLDGDFTVDFSYTINPLTDIATVVITATGEDGTVFETTFTAAVSPQTFIGDCGDTVGPS
ncbi:hypothetical protein ACFOUV_07335 [Oceanobacillus longus]|uniref:Uncharacterized protein n=1 Tax=Oceanobacillus longus TaxID=930120 RepID=A0ABV8GYI1_9BACI